MKSILFLGWVVLARAASGSSNSTANTTTITLSSSSSPSLTSSSTDKIAEFILNGLGATTASLSVSTSIAKSGTTTSSILSSKGQVSNQSITASSSQVPYVNPWAGSFNGTLGPSGTGSLYASECQNEWYSYTSINTDYITASFKTYYFTSTIRSVTVTEIHTYYTTSTYKLCDGHPRVITSAPTAISTTLLPPSTTTFLAEGLSIATYLEPNCTINFDDCAPLWSTYYSASSVYEIYSFQKANTVVSLASGASFLVVDGTTTTYPSPVTAPPTISIGTEEVQNIGGYTWIIVTTPPPGGLLVDDGYTLTPGGVVTIEHNVSTTQTPYTPHCNTDAPTCTPGARCTIDGGSVRLFYFPPQTNVSRNMCATAPVGGGVTSRPPTNFTWTPITTGPYTVTDGNTWFSGNVYLSLDRIQASCQWSSRGVLVGGQHNGEILTMAPSEVFSQRATPIDSGSHSGMFDFEPYAYSFNFADLSSPYPWSAWDAAPDCVQSRCTEIVGSYNPWLAVPEAVRRLDKRWATCDLDLYGLYDPPWAVSSVGNFDPQTTSKDPPLPSPTTGLGVPQSIHVPTSTPIDPPSSLGGIVPPKSSIGGSDLGNPSNPGSPPPASTQKPGSPEPQSSAAGIPQPQSSAAGIPPQTTPATPEGTPPPSGPTTIATVGGQPIVANPGTPGVVVVGGSSTLSAGSPGTVISGTSLSVLDPSHIIIGGPGGSTVQIPTATPPPGSPQSIGTAPIITDPASPGTIVIGTQTLSVGGPGATISGTSISVVDPGHIILSGPNGISTLALPTAAPTGAVLTAPNGQIYTATSLGSSVVIAGSTLSPGGPALTLPGGLTVSDSPSGLIVGPGSSTIPFSALPTAPPSTVVLTASNGQLYTATHLGNSVIIAGSTLSAGGPALTLPGGLTVSDSPSGLVVGSSTIPFSALPTEGAVVTLGGQVYTATEAWGSVVLGTMTLWPGGPAYTVQGTVVSDGSTGLVVGTATVPFSTLAATGTGEVQFTGGVSGRGRGMGIRGGMWMVVLWGVAGWVVWI